ncbi:hypothetical protein FRC03_010206 [Tulasnella sp. 419]|nr:hypothetical protein FRC03_010206 [Tulasnella sp. 419]
MVTEILEMIFEYLVDHSVENRSSPMRSVAIASQVNRHWYLVGQRVLYRNITITAGLQLSLLLRTILPKEHLHDKIHSISVPNGPYIELQPNISGANISADQRRKDEQGPRLTFNLELIKLLKLTTNLAHLTLHSDAFDLFVNGPNGPVNPPPLHNLANLKTLTLLGEHTYRWLFLLPYTCNIRYFSAAPCWRSSDEKIVIPAFSAWNLRTLILKRGSFINGQGLTTDMFESMISVPPSILPPPDAENAPISLIRIMDLEDTPVLGSSHLPRLLSSMTELRQLRIRTHKRTDLKNLARALAQAVPHLGFLETLETNAIGCDASPEETIRSFPPSLTHIIISLHTIGEMPAQAQDDHGLDRSRKNSSAPTFPQKPTIGTTYKTIHRVLDLAHGSSLNKLTIKDGIMSDFLHFHLVGSEYGDYDETKRQNQLWMRAGQMGVLIDVVKPKDTGEYTGRRLEL